MRRPRSKPGADTNCTQTQMILAFTALAVVVGYVSFSFTRGPSQVEERANIRQLVEKQNRAHKQHLYNSGDSTLPVVTAAPPPTDTTNLHPGSVNVPSTAVASTTAAAVPVSTPPTPPPQATNAVLTILTCPKAMQREFKTIQRNAIISWTKLDPPVKIILFGDEEGIPEFAAEIGAQHYNVKTSKHGTPRVDEIWKIAREKATTPVLSFVNSDMLLMDTFSQVAQYLQTKSKMFMAVGQRTRIKPNIVAEVGELDFNSDWKTKVKGLNMYGTAPHAIDLFMWSRGFFKDARMPAFYIGRKRWDNWLTNFGLGRAQLDKTLMIDISNVCFALHFDHEKSKDVGKLNASVRDQESHYNSRIVAEGNPRYPYGRFGLTLSNVKKKLTRCGVKPQASGHKSFRVALGQDLTKPFCIV